MGADQLARVDTWAKANGVTKSNGEPDRSSAIRRLVETGLKG